MTCPKCQGRMKIISFIEDEEVIKKILKHLGLWEMKARPPPKPKASLVTMHFDYSDSQISFADSFYADPDYPISKLMGLLILFGRIGDRVGLPIARAKTPNLPAKEAGTPVLGSPYPTTKASCQVLPGGLEKIPHILGICFLDILLPLLYFRLILKQVLIIPAHPIAVD